MSTSILAPTTPTQPNEWGAPYTYENPETGGSNYGQIKRGIAIVEAIEAPDLPHLTTWIIFDDQTKTCLGVAFSQAEAQRFVDRVLDTYSIQVGQDLVFLLHAFDEAELTRTIGELANQHGVTSQRLAAEWVANGGAWIEENEGIAQ